MLEVVGEDKSKIVWECMEKKTFFCEKIRDMMRDLTQANEPKLRSSHK